MPRPDFSDLGIGPTDEMIRQYRCRLRKGQQGKIQKGFWLDRKDQDNLRLIMQTHWYLNQEESINLAFELYANFLHKQNSVSYAQALLLGDKLIGM